MRSAALRPKKSCWPCVRPAPLQAHARSASAQRPAPAAAAPASPTPAQPVASLQLVGTAALPASATQTVQLAARAVVPGNFSGGIADPQATWDGQSSATGGASLQHYSSPAAPAYPNGAAASFGEAAAGSGYGIQGYVGAAAGAAQVEYSAGSYASSTGLGYGSECAGLAAAAATVAAPQPAADEEEYGDQEVQRSQGSLLNWARPAHRAAQRSFTGPPGRKPGTAAPAPAAAAPAGLAAAASAGSADGQQPARRGISSFLRSVKSTPASLTRPLGQASPPVASPTVAATAAPAAARPPLSSTRIRDVA